MEFQRQEENQQVGNIRSNRQYGVPPGIVATVVGNVLNNLGFPQGIQKMVQQTKTKAKNAFKGNPFKKQKLRQSGTQSVGGSISRFNFGSRKVPQSMFKVHKALGLDRYMVNNYGTLSATGGLQNSALLVSNGTAAQLQTIKALVGGNATTKVFYRNIKSETIISNMSTSNARVDLYDVVARRDLVGNGREPSYAFQHGLTDQGDTNSDYTLYGVTPFNVDIFVQYFNIRKITSIVLAPGSDHVHSTYFGVNTFIDGEESANLAYGKKGFTHFTMAILVGGVVDDAATLLAPSTGPAKISFVGKSIVTYTFISDTNASFTASNNLISYTLAQVQDVNPVSGFSEANAGSSVLYKEAID